MPSKLGPGHESDEGRSLSMDDFVLLGEVLRGEGAAATVSESRRCDWRHEVQSCLHRCADIVYVGAILGVLLWRA
jgi:hypothetical protein